MTKIIIEVRGGIVQAVYTSGFKNEDEIVIIDHDLVDQGEPAVGEVYAPDNTFEPGRAHEMFTDNSASEIEIKDDLKRIKF